MNKHKHNTKHQSTHHNEAEIINKDIMKYRKQIPKVQMKFMQRLLDCCDASADAVVLIWQATQTYTSSPTSH